ncbi:MAG: caspase family protein [Candidatus Methylumidiphilus sp.]
MACNATPKPAPLAQAAALLWLAAALSTSAAAEADKRGLGRPAAPASPGNILTNPEPRPETGLHGAAINQVLALPDGRLLTVSDDKTARLWPAGGDGEPQVLRVPIGKGKEGQLYAAAYSPAINKLAVAGWTGLDQTHRQGLAYVFDVASGKLTGNLSAIQGTVTALAYSANGRFIALGDESGGLRVFDRQTSTDPLADPAACQQNTVCAAQFLSDGRLLVACAGGLLRLYGADFQQQARQVIPKPWRLAVSPQQDRVAVGTLDGPTVGLYSLADLKPVDTLQGEAQRQGNLAVVAWVGDWVFAAGTYGDAQGKKFLRAWHSASHQAREAVLAEDTVTGLAALPDGKLAYVTAEPTVGWVDPATLHATVTKTRATADFRDAFLGTFAFSDDGNVVDFSMRKGGVGPALRFDLDARTLTENPKPRTDLHKPVAPASLKGPQNKDWRNAGRAALAAKPVPLDANEVLRSAASVGRAVLIGAEFSLQLWQADKLAWNIGLSSPAWAVNLSGNGRFALAALGDGSLRWYDTKDGKELLALLAHRDGRWLAWTPDGYFDHAANAANLMGYHINQGPAANPQFVLSGQIHERFYRPELIGAAIVGGAAGKAKPLSAGTMLAQRKPPTVKLLAWCAGGQCTDMPDGKPSPVQVNAEEVTLRLALADQGSGIGNVVVRRNAAATRGLGRPPVATATAGGGQIIEQTVALAPGDNLLSVTAFDATQTVDAGEAIRLPIHYNAAAAPGLPDLYVVSVGINQYASRRVKPLQNAVNDAQGIAAALAKNPRHVFGHVHVTTLTDGQASLANIQQAMAQAAAEAKPKDLVVLFLAGHGVSLDGRFYFLTQDTNMDSDARLKATAWAQTALAESIAALPASRVAVLVDACYAGAFATLGAVKPQQGRALAGALAENTGRFVLAGTSNEQEALDGINGHGVFTSVLLDGLAGRADKEMGNNNQHVTIVELQEYTQQRVPEEARKIAPTHQQNATGFYVGSEFFDLSHTETSTGEKHE